MTTRPHPVTDCIDCPFSSVEGDEWSCAVFEDVRDLGPRRQDGKRLPAPWWCPLREASRLVKLRVL